MVAFWMVAGCVLGGFYGWLWASILVPGDKDDQSMREWERRQAEFRHGRR